MNFWKKHNEWENNQISNDVTFEFSKKRILTTAAIYALIEFGKKRGLDLVEASHVNSETGVVETENKGFKFEKVINTGLKVVNFWYPTGNSRTCTITGEKITNFNKDECLFLEFYGDTDLNKYAKKFKTFGGRNRDNQRPVFIIEDIDTLFEIFDPTREDGFVANVSTDLVTKD